ncbi:hypothetical protein GCM10017744_094980 [Streptomyces antimycoticus]|uniref:Uncharacterized protein n=1 Tax=Streptomyces antimycoticus TaxID=68175 RepID=A0A4D4JVY9_9ACTN|nr:hypothetical protein SANT12839_007140 [Streptomyces antimycoticus]
MLVTVPLRRALRLIGLTSTSGEGQVRYVDDRRQIGSEQWLLISVHGQRVPRRGTLTLRYRSQSDMAVRSAVHARVRFTPA